MRPRILLLLALLALALIPSARAAAPYAPIPTCSPGPAACPSWHTANVAISWQFEPGWTQVNCDSRPVTEDTATEQRSCSVSYGPDDVYSRTITVRRDATPPQVTAMTPSRPADSGAWYRQPLTVAVAGADATSGIASCSSPSYSGGDGAAVAVSGTCSDAAGNTSAPASFAFKYDATPPTVSPSVDRPPDGKGWYRKPVTVSFAGTDATSGIVACTAPTRYAGPDLPQAAVVGSCRDAAGNSAEAGRTFQYDATAPALAKTEAKVDKGVARIGWERAGDVVEVELVRSPGINGAKSTIVYRGNGAAFVDKTVKAGIRYRYEISVADLAGNVTTKAVVAAAAGGQEEHGPARACLGLHREGAATAPVEGGEGRDLLQRSALPERRQGAEHVAERDPAPSSPRRGRTAARSSGSGPATTAGTSGARAARARSPSTGKCSARARSPSSADRHSKARPRRESSWSA